MHTPPAAAAPTTVANDEQADNNTRQLKEMLYRVEAERLVLQQQATGLADNKQQLTADVLKLRQQLAEAHATLAASQQQANSLSQVRDRLQVQVTAATAEYRANDIIAIGLRDQITSLQRELRDSQHVCSQQAAEIATFADDMAELRRCKADLTQQLSDLQQQHHQLGEQHASALQQLARAQQEAQEIQRRWVDEHGGQVQALEAMQDARQQAEQQAAELTTQLEQEQQRLAQQRDRCSELKGELTRIRELVVLLGKAIGRQPGGAQLPGHDDPVWQKLGPLGGVSFALDTVIKHTREQHVRVKELQAEADTLQDRVRAESAQKADLQSELYDARTMYAEAVAVREQLEARTARAEAEKEAADNSWQQAQTQAKEDGSRLSSLQEQVMSLTQQVQVLQPLQPKLSTAEVERDTALHKLERLQEQYDQLQRQLQHATARESGLQADVDAYKLEHTQLLAANKQLMAQCTGLNKDVQALEVEVREGSLVKGQLEEAKRKLGRTKTQLQAMTERHVDTLNRLENTKDLLASPSAAGNDSSMFAAGGKGSRPTSAWSRGSRPGTAGTRLSGLPGGNNNNNSTGSSPRASPRSSVVGAAQQQIQQGTAPAGAAATASQGSSGGAGASSAAHDGAASAGSIFCMTAAGRPVGQPAAAGANYMVVDAGGSQSLAAAGLYAAAGGAGVDEDGVGGDENGDQMQCSTSHDLDVMLRQRELERLVDDQQMELDELQEQLGQQQVHIAELEVQLLRQEAEHLQQQCAGEAAVGQQCLAAAGEAVGALQAALHDLQQAMEGPQAGGDEDSSGSSSMPDQQQGEGTQAAPDAVAGQALVTSSSSSSSSSTRGSDSAAAAAVALGEEAGQQQPEQKAQQRCLSRIAAQMVSNMQGVVEQAQARAALVAARQDVGVQSDEALQLQWLTFIRLLPDATVSQPLHIKAASEAILRLYMRALGQLEAAGGGGVFMMRQQQQGVASAATAAVGGGGGFVSVLTVFDLLMAHYSPPAAAAAAQSHLSQRPGGGGGGAGASRLSVQPYSAALWRDPQGPITRLLLSCRSLAPSSVKVALFCCLAGTHTPCYNNSSSSSSAASGFMTTQQAPWGLQHWQQFLLLLHAAKVLTGGLWKGLLRDWAAASGAMLPLQCVLDLLGNVYNVSSLSGLDQQPAVLGSKQALLHAVSQTGQEQQQSQTAVSAVGPPCSRGGGGSSSNSSSRAATASSGAAGVQAAQQQQQQQLQTGSVSAALGELVVDGPLGPASAVDFDDLLAMLMMQYHAGLLPPHPLLQPRRLTTGDLGNTTNAWGSAASEASSLSLGGGGAAGCVGGGASSAGGGSGVLLGRRPTALLASSLSGGQWLPGEGLSAAEAAGSGGFHTQQQQYYSAPDSPGAFSTASGGGDWLSRPTTGAAGSTTSRIGTAVASAAAPGSPVMLPRLRTPDSAVAKDTQRSGALSGGGSNSQQGPIRKGVSMARVVAFKEP